MSDNDTRTARLVRWLTVPFWSRLDGFVLGAVCALAILQVGWLGWVTTMLALVGLNIGTRLVLRVAKPRGVADASGQESS